VSTKFDCNAHDAFLEEPSSGTLSQQRYQPSDSNTNVDIKFNAHDAFLEEPSSGTLKVSRGINPVIVIQM
jgi:hypothetical protein